MKSLPFAFVASGTLALLIGMVWGIQMSASHDHTLAPAHAHLNLLGFVLMSIYGFYYHLVPEAQTMLGKVHFGLTLLGVVLIVPGIVMAINETTELFAVIGSFITLASALVFAVVVLRNRAA